MAFLVYHLKHCLLMMFVILLGISSTLANASVVNIVYTHENHEFGKLIKTFAEEYPYQVKVTWLDQSDLKSRMVNLQNIRETPDVIIMPADSLGMAEASGLTEISPKDLSNEFSLSTIQTVQINNKIFGIPIVQGNHLLLYYNKSLVDEPAKNWRALLAQQSKIPEGKKLISWSFMEMYWFIPFITAYGEPPLVDDKPDLDTNSMREALKFAWSLSQSGIVDERCNYNCADTLFKDANSAYIINGIWAYKSYKQILDDDLGVISLPAIGPNQMLPYYSTLVASFPNASFVTERKDVYDNFIRFIQSDGFQQKLWDELQEIPANERILTSIKENSSTEVLELLSTLDTTLPMSSDPNMSIIWEVILKGYLRYGSGIWDAARTTQYMQSLALQHIKHKESD
jgi:maltose-binding protein MalE